MEHLQSLHAAKLPREILCYSVWVYRPMSAAARRWAGLQRRRRWQKLKLSLNEVKAGLSSVMRKYLRLLVGGPPHPAIVQSWWALRHLCVIPCFYNTWLREYSERNKVRYCGGRAPCVQFKGKGVTYLVSQKHMFQVLTWTKATHVYVQFSKRTTT